MTRRRRSLWALLSVWFAAVLWLTLRSNPEQAGRVVELRWYCVLCGEAGSADFLLNLLMFAPLGVIGRALNLARSRVFVFAALLTITIETIQWHFLVGRDGSLGDVLANSGGAVLGWFAYPLLWRLARPTMEFARGACIAVLMVSALVWIGTGIGLRPAPSRVLPWVGQLQHRWPGRPAFAGRITSASINGIDIPNDPLIAPPAIIDTVNVRIALTRLDARFLPGLASLIRIVDGMGRPQLSMTASGFDVIAEIPIRATTWGLHTPEWNFTGGMAFRAGEPWALVTQWHRDRITLTTISPSGTVAKVQSTPLSIGLGWVFIHPFVRTVGSNAHLWNRIWIAWWFALLGWLAGWLSWRVVAVTAVIQLLLLLAAVAVTGTPWHADEVAVGLAAALAAATVAQVVRQSAP